jgi:3-mercaptopyruvate sulfurtransferase SseA
MARNSFSKNMPIILIIVGLILVGGAIGWLAFTVYQANQLNTNSNISQPPDVTNQRIPYPDIKRVSIQDAKAAYDIGNAVFLDVRGVQYYDQAHIKGALSIPEDELPQRLDELQKSDWIITYCT